MVSASAVVFHYEEVLYQVYASLVMSLVIRLLYRYIVNCRLSMTVGCEGRVSGVEQLCQLSARSAGS